MSKPANRNGMSRTDMEQMSTAGLEQMLLEDFYSSGHGETGMDDLYMAAQILSERDSNQHNAADQAWERVRENCLPFAVVLAEDGGMPSSADSAQGRRRCSLRRRPVRAVLAAVLCALLLSVSVAAANGYDLMHLLAQWTDEQIWLAPGQISPVAEDDIHIPEKPKDYASLQEALEGYGFTRPVAPQWLPEGFAMKELVTDQFMENELIFNALYKRGEDSLVVFVCIYLDYGGGADRNYSDFQKDEGDPTLYEAGGVTHMLATNAGRPVAVWANGPAECAVSGDITMEELERMIDSIY